MKMAMTNYYFHLLVKEPRKADWHDTGFRSKDSSKEEMQNLLDYAKCIYANPKNEWKILLKNEEI